MLKVLNSKFEQKVITQSADISIRISVPKRYKMMMSSIRMTKNFYVIL